jgi:DNA helicase HerA-like ATPase
MLQDRDKITYFAQTNSRGKAMPFGIKRRDRERHMYVIGKTGMGKSTLLENMAIQDVRNGEGMAFIDPHGSTAERILEYVPEHRIKDVVYFAPFDMDHPLAFNVMEDVGYDKRHLVVSGLLVGVPQNLGPRLVERPHGIYPFKHTVGAFGVPRLNAAWMLTGCWSTKTSARKL